MLLIYYFMGFENGRRCFMGLNCELFKGKGLVLDFLVVGRVVGV